MGGEKLFAAAAAGRARGSPPHGRGKGMYDLRWMVAQRITPAWAGKSVVGVVLGELVEDHPRMGGEKWF